ncbi:phage tail assembly chaperone [Pseudomonas nunensis]|uniref:phage tail assembly chaperone n=1 Tax=Pseudomonas nunensis TaxID=2961896 RepID=UPI0025B0C50C|nr:phage tail assembly chaperone [Pseudomonas nunensis]MDN3222760.1 phage tail assembly chaperone [Pseudomonas nunensis]
MSYQLTKDPDTVIRLPDGATVPLHHRFWDEYQQWLASGGVPLPAMLEGAPQAAKVARNWRDQELAASQWLVDRDRDEQAAGTPMTLSSDEYHELLDYRQDLRDWPSMANFPNDFSKPLAPVWLKTSANGT